MYLDVLLSVDVHVDERAEPNQTLPHLHVALPGGTNHKGLDIDTCVVPNIKSKRSETIF